MTSDRSAAVFATAALLLAIVAAAPSSGASTADIVVDNVSPGNQLTTLDPAPPVTFAAPDSRPAGAIFVAWTESPTASVRSETRYSVHRSPAGANTWTLVVNGLTALSYTDTPSSDGSYDYKVHADVSGFYAATAVRAGVSDRLDPGISGSFAPAPNANGWNKENVTVSFICSDGGSGIATCNAPVIADQEGTTVVTGVAQDAAGNTASTGVTVKIDKTRPSEVSNLTSQSGAALGVATVEVSWVAATDVHSGVHFYTVHWTTSVIGCPIPSPADYPSSAATTGTSYSIVGSLLTSYCAYVTTHDRAGNQTDGGTTGPTAAQ